METLAIHAISVRLNATRTKQQRSIEYWDKGKRGYVSVVVHAVKYCLGEASIVIVFNFFF